MPKIDKNTLKILPKQKIRIYKFENKQTYTCSFYIGTGYKKYPSNHFQKTCKTKNINEAISKAKNQGLDLIEIAPNANPPVCKIMDMGKFKYDAQKKANLAKKKQKIIALKEIKMRPVTETHDYEFKVKNAKKFIAKGDKVKFTIRFKGRELQHSHLGNELMTKIKEDMKEIGKVELHPKFDGKQMIMVIQPL